VVGAAGEAGEAQQQQQQQHAALSLWWSGCS
jgi:hypothetical protein